MLATNVSADTDGENNLSKKNSGEVKDCFENVNRATFKFNQVLDGVIFEPVAKAYRILPSPVRAGTGNALDNLSTLVTQYLIIFSKENLKKLELTQVDLLLIQQLALLEYLMWLKKLVFQSMKKKIMAKHLV